MLRRGARRLGTAAALALILAWLPPARADDSAPRRWLAPDRAVQVADDGQARSLYQPEFRGAPYLHEQLAQHELTGLTAELVTPVVATARPRGARKDPPPVYGRILLRGPEALVRRARRLLRKLDLAPRAVFVSLLVSEVSRASRRSSGGSLVFDKPTASVPGGGVFRGFSTSFEPDDYLRSTITGVTPYEGGTVTLGDPNVEGAAFAYALRMLQREGEAEFLAWPSLLVNEGEPASMTATRVVPQLLLTDEANESVSVVPEETGLKLRVTPQKIGREEAVLDLDVWLRLPEEVHDARAIGGTLRLKLRQVTTRITVRDREPLLIGGLVLKRKDRERAGLPRPPEFGALDPLHSTRLRDEAETEIVFLVRPRIVPPGRRPAELDPATYRAWTAGRALPDPWRDVHDPAAGSRGRAPRRAGR